MPEINYNIRLKLSGNPNVVYAKLKKATSVLLIIKCIELMIWIVNPSARYYVFVSSNHPPCLCCHSHPRPHLW